MNRTVRNLMVFAVMTAGASSTPAALAQRADGNPQTNPPSDASLQVNLLQVKLRLLHALSSSNAKKGYPVTLVVIDPIESNGREVVSSGALAHATVTRARHRGLNYREGRVVVTVQSVTLTDGHSAPLHSALLEKGSGHGQPIFGPCTFPIPADPVGLFRKGEDVVIPAGTIVTASLAL